MVEFQNNFESYENVRFPFLSIRIKSGQAWVKFIPEINNA
jgi:hypothetical protein